MGYVLGKLRLGGGSVGDRHDVSDRRDRDEEDVICGAKALSGGKKTISAGDMLSRSSAGRGHG